MSIWAPRSCAATGAEYYSEGATCGAPAATQVADRWHLWSNIGDAIEDIVRRLRSQWNPPAPEPARLRIPSQVDGPLAENIPERFAAVHALGDKGMAVGRIAEQLRIDRRTARKYLKAAEPEELITGVVASRRTVLDDHAEILARPWSEGCDSGELLHRGWSSAASRSATVSCAASWSRCAPTVPKPRNRRFRRPGR
jgi:hypothetical protein